ncbi:MAG: tRNA(5-methylaminomethyl-2-thiouridylate) methyltransferase [Desulfovibrionaceae bacterium]|nr:tRNA(5-methylaminomethyl-2-thiouridylate) methyltransferase [Desulfovibrionaceae bacterium]
MSNPQVIVLFSGGLDSILAAKVLASQGLSVLGLHATSPFFGNAAEIPTWEKLYDLPIRELDLSEAMVQMLLTSPQHGFGKVLNPCIDCKILLLQQAKLVMQETGAFALASGAVSGQRPMSQRKDALNLISKAAGVQDILVRPLSALQLPITLVEKSGLIQREQLLSLNGRGRSAQMALAEKFGLKVIPTPAGGCHLTEQENARRYFMVMHKLANPQVQDFALANYGRQLWSTDCHWLVVGRNKSDNDKIRSLLSQEDALIDFPGLPAPVALARFGTTWPQELLESAAQQTLSYATKALRYSTKGIARIKDQGQVKQFKVEAKRSDLWDLPSWDTIHGLLVARRKENLQKNTPTL